MPTPAAIEAAVLQVKDHASLLQRLLAETLDWPIPDKVARPEDLAHGWTLEDLRAQGLDKKLVEGTIWQLQLRTKQPWGIFLVEFAHDKAYRTVLRQVLRGLVPSRRRDAALPAWKHDNLLFICTTRDYQNVTFAHFRGEKAQSARLATFGWHKDDRHVRTLCEFNLPKLVWPDDAATNEAGWLEKWAAAFDVEAVTKRFFAEYAQVFQHVEDSVKGVPAGETRRMYTQRLFNRLLFLYFIQRKGWMSFEGNKNYLRAMFDASTRAKEDFLNERLYWTFFYGLNTANEDDKTHSAAELKERRGEVPFLNGGLFDLEDQYDVRDKVKIPNSAFARILDLFERYNFTVAESTPLDIEVAVDPEMLGKVFEELVTGRHESGSYYTPRPIVSFMCREALKHYLVGRPSQADSPVTEVGLGRPTYVDAVARFVDEGDPSALRDPEAVLDALRAVKVCDPACGSGAYLLGMMQELLRLREALFAVKVKDSASVYDRKLEIIENNLYGVDIDLFAVNIAKLRLWLSLAVDFDGTKPPPLPNLDFKIECGDSLTAPDPQKIDDLFRGLLVEKADELAELKGEYLKTYGAKKKELEASIKAEEAKLRDRLSEQSPDGAVDWRVAFAEVFRGGGFDVVLGNPPYVRQEEIKHLKPALKKIYECYSGVADLFVYFYERGIKLLKPGGQFAFITSNKWYRSGYGEKLRTWLGLHTRLHRLIDFGDAPIFEAIAYPTIVLLERSQPGEGVSFRALTWQPGPPIEQFAAVVHAQSMDIPQKSLDKTGWRLEGSAKRNLLDKLRAAGTPLGEYFSNRIYLDIKTGLNDAFVVNRETRDQLIVAHTSSAALLKPFLRGRDVKRWRAEYAEQYLIKIESSENITHPWSGKSKKAAEESFAATYPAIHEFQMQYRTELLKRTDQGKYPWELRSCAYWQEFEKPKIAYPDIYEHQSLAFDRSGIFLTNTCYFIPNASEWMTALLNSSVIEWFYGSVSNRIRGGYLRAFSDYMKLIPIPAVSPDQQAELEKLVQRIINECEHGRDVSALESEVNERVYHLFGLTREEIAIIEDS